MVRVRFAPSPTGYLHVGAARTALFNWLFARHEKGVFILRIEDTDVSRSSEQMSQVIMEGLLWLGLAWDEGPIFQSKRLQIYQEKALWLLNQGKAYECFCSPEEIETRKREIEARGGVWKYDRYCWRLSLEEKEMKKKEGRKGAIRFLVPPGRTQFKDLIHGVISVDHSQIEDFVLLRSDGLPTYHLSVVVDDLDSRITHVIRGDDHITNTPKQILLYQAFGATPPEFAHLPLILGPDRKKLSKRHGVTSLLHYRDQGILPLAMFNFLAQMSWSPGPEERIYSIDEMVANFSLNRISKNSPIFDLNKLEWLNRRLIKEMKAEELLIWLKPEMEKKGLWQPSFEKENWAWFKRVLDLIKGRSRNLIDLIGNLKPFITEDYLIDPIGYEKYLREEKLLELLPRLRKDFELLTDFVAPEIEKTLRKRAEQEGVQAALFIHALRVLTLGKTVSPGIFEVLELLGKEKTLARMNLETARTKLAVSTANQN
ncbi:MAG: glutamate--tRNA ligase [Candidatus Aminicenantes bacterium]|nr:glutamate--tRNA ligase [Candidatus Aminicenantes bacterium]